MTDRKVLVIRDAAELQAALDRIVAVLEEAELTHLESLGVLRLAEEEVLDRYRDWAGDD